MTIQTAPSKLEFMMGIKACEEPLEACQVKVRVSLRKVLPNPCASIASLKNDWVNYTNSLT